MITYFKRKELDTVKYDACIKNAVNSRIYAFSWYLDCIADNWDVLVLNDYEAVMPLPWREKYLVKYVYLTPWTQQLGVFSIKTLDKVTIVAFLTKIPKKFKLVEQFLNASNKIKDKKRVNYILPLQKTYTELSKKFSDRRKRSIKKAQKSNLIIKSNHNALQIIALFKEQKSNEVKRDENDYLILNKLTTVLAQKNQIKIIEVYLNNDFIGGAIFLLDAKRITYLFSALGEKGRTLNVMSLLINNLISEYANTHYVFDFEGSMMKNIASFFKSFGAEIEHYYHYKKQRLF